MFREVARIICVGDSAVGKTCLIRQFTDHKFDFDSTTTLGNSSHS